MATVFKSLLDNPETYEQMEECPDCYGEGDDAQGRECELCMGLGAIDLDDGELLH